MNVHASPIVRRHSADDLLDALEWLLKNEARKPIRDAATRLYLALTDTRKDEK